MSPSPTTRPAGFILHENSVAQLELWLDLQSAIPADQAAYTYFLHDSVHLLNTLGERNFERQASSHLMACSLALRENAVIPEDYVLPSGLPTLGRMLTSCVPVHHFSQQYPKLISEALQQIPSDSSPPLHLQVAPDATRISLLTEALRIVYGVSQQTDIQITLGLSDGQKTVLSEDPLCSARLHELVSTERFCCNPPENAQQIIF